MKNTLKVPKNHDFFDFSESTKKSWLIVIVNCDEVEKFLIFILKISLLEIWTGLIKEGKPLLYVVIAKFSMNKKSLMQLFASVELQRHIREIHTIGRSYEATAELILPWMIIYLDSL